MPRFLGEVLGIVIAVCSDMKMFPGGYGMALGFALFGGFIGYMIPIILPVPMKYYKRKKRYDMYGQPIDDEDAPRKRRRKKKVQEIDDDYEPRSRRRRDDEDDCDEDKPRRRRRYDDDEDRDEYDTRIRKKRTDRSSRDYDD